MKNESITCDNCKGDLSTTGNSIDWRIGVYNERIHSAGGIVTDMYIYPPLSNNLHFCNVGCLKKWVNKNI